MKFLKLRKHLPIYLIIIISLLILILPVLTTFSSAESRIVNTDEVPEESVLIIFGAGVNKKHQPNDALSDRLSTGADIYNQGKVSRIYVSGNNSDKNNNETSSMKKTLVEDYDIPEEIITEDEYGNRSYDTCVRAKELFDIDCAVLVTQRYHLYRALYLCNNLGVNSTGVSATNGMYEDGFYYLVREYFATHKALIDLLIMEPKYSLE